MYSFEPNEEQKMLIETIQRYATVNLRPKAHDAEEESQLPPDLIEKGWEMGLLQASIPEEYGGFGERSAVTGVLAAEEFAFGDLAGALAIMAPSLYATPILLAGTEEQKQEYLPPVIEAEWKPYTAALIEPQFDFDPNNLQTTAREDGEKYVLVGEKVLVPYADNAEGLIVYANLDGQPQGFIVPGGYPGLEVAERQKLMGVNGLSVYRVCLNELRIPKQNRLGGADGHDFAPLLAASRAATAALALGLSRAAFEYARDYAKDREVFGVKVAQKQAIAFMLAEMATEIEAIRLLTWKAAWAIDQAKPEAGKLAYLAHTGATDMTMMVTDRAVQILGGHGYIREHPVEMWMRNGRGIAAFTGMAIV
ncbi:MAG TPA: acyl-CoA dehydrogenase family protein [Anaerolineales bacterium]|nr:acyl-CoA dehydrogenase family protein [Anaerolineales bacterium]